MKTIDDLIKMKYPDNTFDGRVYDRLIKYIPEDKLEDFGIELNPEYVGTHVAVGLTRENILADLKEDLEFAFEKALNKRGLSSASMFDVIKMYNDILEEGLENWSDDNYAQYGLPLYKATAMKYGFDNPIGTDKGDEEYYSAEYDEND